MSILNELQEVGLGQVLRRRLGISATGSPAPALAPELFPCVVLEQDRPEWKFLANERLMTAVAAQAAVAGQFSTFRFTNPANSGVLAVIESFHARCPNTIMVYRSTSPLAPLLNVADGFPRDTRFAFQTPVLSCVCQFTSDGQAAVAPTNERGFQIGANVLTSWDCEIVVSPGHTLDWIVQTVNVSAELTILWRERAALVDELRS